ncbi:unnamed protein product [Adineta steineri]|uniref:Uncharacterized protein n=1 Tax=Adineta steineri TaxID=433720 RepID=A0A814RXI2_9BILA|nr:unnamed protein product [Adineta steineri]CAF1212926.1 unnamed protein product [Adineta steineri]CAF1529521.1 unnamed protein product [Adineta steineri]CAF3778576.1 unnamed protein product [Adineta steineri]CAF3944072.1 unnamed protein product [Adineta steineri]
MGIEKLTKKRKTIFSRLTNKLLTTTHHHQQSSKRDQSVQTSLNISQTSSQLTATVLVNSHLRQRTCSPKNSINNSIHTPHTSRRGRRRSSLKTFIISHSPKPISLVQRTRRRSVDLKTPKRLSSECLQVALIRKIQPVNRYGSPLALSSTTSSNIISVTRQKPYLSSPRESFDYPTISHYAYPQTIFNDETTNRDELFSIGPMKWSTPNRTIIYKTSSPYNNNNFDHHRRLCTVDQLSFSNILDGSD